MTNQTVTTALSKAADSGVVGDARVVVLSFLRHLDAQYHGDRELAYGIGRLRQMVEEA